jgi:glutamate synthase domain-containing protein 3
MSGGIAYVLDADGSFPTRCNTELVGFDPLEDSDVETVRALVEEHLARTGSAVAQRILDDWEAALPSFVKVMPHDYKRALAEGFVDRSDHPVSAGGTGFLTSESEAAA